MTRAEATKILSRIWGGNPQHDLANSYADAFVALGMLNLDEPKNTFEQFRNVVATIPYGDRHSDVLWNSLERAGLKIVEK